MWAWGAGVSGVAGACCALGGRSSVWWLSLVRLRAACLCPPGCCCTALRPMRVACCLGCDGRSGVLAFVRAVLVSCCGCLFESFCGCLFCSCLCDLRATSGGVHCIRCGVCSRSFLCNSVCAVCSCSCLCALCAVCSRSFLCIVIVVCSSSCLCVWCAVFSCSFLCRGGLFVPAVFSAVGGVLVAILAFSVGWLSVSCVGVSRFHGEAPLGVSLRRGGVGSTCM